MKFPATVASAALLLAALASAAAEPAMTWQEANKQSAALIRSKGPSMAAADLARQAFDLYPRQTKAYDAANHVQLLMNLSQALAEARGAEAALFQLERGAEAVAGQAGSSNPVLITVWQEAAALVPPGDSRVGVFHQRAVDIAERTWGADNPNTIALLVTAAAATRKADGYEKTAGRYRAARKRAVNAGEDSTLVAQIDLAAAKLELESGRQSAAIEGYRALIGRLEKRGDGDGDRERVLDAAYSQLEYAYVRGGHQLLAKEVRELRLERLGIDAELLPVYRVRPHYPRAAIRDGTQGVVKVQVTVGTDGSVLEAKVIQTSARVFDAPTLEAVRQWKFKPRIVDGQPVEVTGSQLIEFKLEED